MGLCAALRNICVGLIIWIVGAAPAWCATRHVVLLFDERPELPGLALLEADLVSTLRANSTEPIEIYREAMDLSRFASGTYETTLRDILRAKYADKKIDVVVGIIGPALEFLLKYGEAIFPGTPIVFCGIDRKELGERSLPPHVRGVLVKREFAPTLDIVLGLHPGTKQVFVVAGTSDFDDRLLNQARSEFLAYAERVAFTYLSELPLPDVLAEVAKLPPQSVVLFTTFFRDSAGQSFITHEVVQRVSAAASAPVYGFLDQYLGRGIVGGSLYSTAAHGTEAAKLILQVLTGSVPAGPSMLEAQSNKVQFDWRQMQRWGINASSLPAGSEIRFRDPTLWDQYKWQVLLVGAALLLQAGLIGWLLHERQSRRQAEATARDTMSELVHVNRTATAGELSATIAHEVNQPLAAMVVQANAGLRWLSGDAPNVGEARDALREIVNAGHRAREVVKNVRAMFRKDTGDKSPVDINKLIWTVLGLVHIDLRKHGIELRTGLGEDLPAAIGNEVQLQQVILNLVMNAIDAMQSADRRVLSISSELVQPDRLQVSIEDSGSGIDPSDLGRIFKPLFTTKTRGMGMGLSICQSILEAHDGRIWAAPAVNGGSIFRFELPARSTSDERSIGTPAAPSAPPTC